MVASATDEEYVVEDIEEENVVMVAEEVASVAVKETAAGAGESSDKTSAFMGVAKDATLSAEDVLSTPLPGETVALFYSRSSEPSPTHFWII